MDIRLCLWNGRCCELFRQFRDYGESHAPQVPFVIRFWSVRVARTPSRNVQVGRKSVVFWLKQSQGHRNASVPRER